SVGAFERPLVERSALDVVDPNILTAGVAHRQGDLAAIRRKARFAVGARRQPQRRHLAQTIDPDKALLLCRFWPGIDENAITRHRECRATVAAGNSYVLHGRRLIAAQLQSTDVERLPHQLVSIRE